jgi:hypothetical protein
MRATLVELVDRQGILDGDGEHSARSGGCAAPCALAVKASAASSGVLDASKRWVFVRGCVQPASASGSTLQRKDSGEAAHKIDPGMIAVGPSASGVNLDRQCLIFKDRLRSTPGLEQSV